MGALLYPPFGNEVRLPMSSPIVLMYCGTHSGNLRWILLSSEGELDTYIGLNYNY